MNPIKNDVDIQVIGEQSTVSKLVTNTSVKLISALTVVLLVFCFGLLVAKDDLMSPVVKSGQVVLVDKLTTRLLAPEQGELVRVNIDGENAIKRVIATPGDNLIMRNGYVYVNDWIVEEKYVSEKNKSHEFNIQLKENQYFLLEDNRKEVEVSEANIVNLDNINGRILDSSLSKQMQEINSVNN